MTDISDRVVPLPSASLIERRGMRLRDLAESAADPGRGAEPDSDIEVIADAPVTELHLLRPPVTDAERRSRARRRIIAGGIALVAIAGVAVVGLGLSRAGDAPTVVAAPTAEPTVSPLTGAARTHAFCAAADQFRMDDLRLLAGRVIDAPDQEMAAFNAMKAAAPAELAAAFAAQEPTVHKVEAAAKAGQITTASEFQQFLAGQPQDEILAWARGESQIVPTIEKICH